MAVVCGFLDTINNKTYTHKCGYLYVITAETEHPSLSTFDLNKRKGF